jgi:peptidyl-prolyl cis-trans isomerase C
MRRIPALGLALTLLLGVVPSPADQPSDVVVTVGESSVTAKELSERLKKYPPYQIATLGKTPQEIRKTFVEKVIVPELLQYEEAKRRKLDAEDPGRRRVIGVLQKAVEEQVKDEAAQISPVDIANYYDSNRHRFNTPKRIKIWRIVVPTEADAKKIIAEVSGVDLQSLNKWNEAAKKSADKSTALRNGELGFVTPDGQTDTPQLKVDPAIYAAADKVKDGEIVKDPVKEGERWSVIWRRGSLEPVVRSLAQESPNIQKILGREKVEEAVGKLIKQLRDEKVKNVATELLEYVEIDPSGDVGTRQKPGIVSRHDARGTPIPKRGERGLR